MKKEYHVFWAGNAWSTDEIELNPEEAGVCVGKVRFNVQTKDGKFKVTLTSFDFITEKLNDIIVPSVA